MKRLAMVFFVTSVADAAPCRLPALGWLEHVLLKSGADSKITAKVDTGAKSSSLHATEIKVVDRNGRKIVTFRTSAGGKSVAMEAPLAKESAVKSSDGDEESRQFVELTLCVGGQTVKTLVSLNDRKAMAYPMLLGRRFLENRYLVDPSATFLAGEPRCP